MFEKIRKDIQEDLRKAFDRELEWVRDGIKDVVKAYDRLIEKGEETADGEVLALLKDLESVHESIERHLGVNPKDSSDTIDLSKPEVTT